MPHIADYQSYANSVDAWIKKWTPVGIAPPHNRIRHRIDMGFRQKMYPIIDYIKPYESGSPPIRLPRVLHSALETVKYADRNRTVLPFEDIRANDPRLPESYATRPPTPDNTPQPLADLVDDPLEDLDIDAIHGPLVWAVHTFTDGAITHSVVRMTTPKDSTLEEWRVTGDVEGTGEAQ